MSEALKCGPYVSWWRACPALLERIEEWRDGRQVQGIRCESALCFESEPCQGHGVMRLIRQDGYEYWAAVGSVEIGVVQSHYFAKDADPHFTHYAQGYEEWNADRLRRQNIGLAILACCKALRWPREWAAAMCPPMPWELRTAEKSLSDSL